MANPIFVLDVSEEGIVATHHLRVELPFLVAPTPEVTKKEFHNTLRPSLVAIGCMNLSNRGFDFDSSFVAPRAAGRFTAFGEMMTHLRKHDPKKENRFPPVSIFGHADPTGDNEEYNKALSGRRTQAVFGVLTRDVPLWEKLFSNPLGGDNWGQKSIQSMLQTVGGAIPFYLGPIDGAVTPETKQETKEAIEEYQKARGISPVTGTAGPQTRKILFLEYMNDICKLKNGDPWQLDPIEHFLCRGKDKGRKGDLMGCSEFNPVLLATADEEKEFKKPENKEFRDTVYEDDRRVLVYVYKHDSEIDPAKWPCPRVSEGTTGCRDRFWADHKKRLERGEERRKFKKTGDTMACRWYHAFAAHSPCEVGRKLWVIRLRLDGAKDKQEPLANRAYVVKAGDTPYAPMLRGFTDKNGQLEIPVFHEKGMISLKVDFFGLVVPPEEAEDTPPAEGEPAPAEGTAGAGEDGAGDGASPPAGGDGAGGNSAGAEPAGEGEDTAAAPPGFDADRFENEDRFLELLLDTGNLEQISPENLPSEQRLYNLGFGKGKPGSWDDDTRRRAVKGFQRTRSLEVTGELDDATRERLKTDHEGPDAEQEPEPATT